MKIISLFIWRGVKRARKRDRILRSSFARFDFTTIPTGSRITVHTLSIDLWAAKERSRRPGAVCGTIWKNILLWRPGRNVSQVLHHDFEIEFISVSFPLNLVQYHFVVVISQGSTEFVIVHVWFVFTTSPFSGNFFRIDYSELPI